MVRPVEQKNLLSRYYQEVYLDYGSTVETLQVRTVRQRGESMEMTHVEAVGKYSHSNKHTQVSGLFSKVRGAM